MRIVATTVSLAVGLLIAQAAHAGDHQCAAPGCCEQVVRGTPDCCGHCGSKACCKKYCKVVCEMKEVTKHCWCVECEDFCAPLPGCGHKHGHCADPGCGSCDPGCCTADGCGSSCGKCAGCCNKQKCLVPPKCGKVRTKKKLVKKEYTCMVPVYKCVVVYACHGCCDPAACDPGCAVPGGEGQPADPAPAPADEAPLPPAPKASGNPGAFPSMTSLQRHLHRQSQ